MRTTIRSNSIYLQLPTIFSISDPLNPPESEWGAPCHVHNTNIYELLYWVYGGLQIQLTYSPRTNKAEE